MAQAESHTACVVPNTFPGGRKWTSITFFKAEERILEGQQPYNTGGKNGKNTHLTSWESCQWINGTKLEKNVLNFWIVTHWRKMMY
jgi:hypothetical protein